MSVLIDYFQQAALVILANIFSFFVMYFVVKDFSKFFVFIRKKAREKENQTDVKYFGLYSSKFYRVTSIVVTSLFGITSWYLLFNVTDNPDFTMVFTVVMLFFFLGLFLLFYSFRVKLAVKDDQLIYTPLFGNKREYKVCDITSFKTKENIGLSVYSENKKLFTIDPYYINYRVLISYLICNGVKAPEHLEMQDEYFAEDWKYRDARLNKVDDFINSFRDKSHD